MVKEMNGKSKVTGLRAKSTLSKTAGKDPKMVITGNKVNKTSVDLPESKGKKPMLKAKSK